jgi:hypothetical protein
MERSMEKLTNKIMDIIYHKPIALYCAAIDIALVCFISAGMMQMDMHDIIIILIGQLFWINTARINTVLDRIKTLEAFHAEVENAKEDIERSVSPIKIYEVK